MIEDTRQFAGWIETPPSAWVRSYLCAPLRSRDQVVGFFNLDSAQPNFFTKYTPSACWLLPRSRRWRLRMRGCTRRRSGVCKINRCCMRLDRLFLPPWNSTRCWRRSARSWCARPGADRFDSTVGSVNGSDQDYLSTHQDDRRSARHGLAGKAVCADGLSESGAVPA